MYIRMYMYIEVWHNELPLVGLEPTPLALERCSKPLSSFKVTEHIYTYVHVHRGMVQPLVGLEPTPLALERCSTH